MAGSEQPSGEIVSKSEFARRVSVVPGRVTQWIADGKIFGAALDGEGRSARICVPIAIEQLRDTLDADHRARAGAKAKLDGIASAPARPVITEASLQRLAARLSDAIAQVLRREFVIEEPADEFPGQNDGEARL